MRWLFLIFFLFPSIALAGQAEQKEVDQVLEGLKPCLLAFVHLNKSNNGVIQREARLQLFLKVDEELFSVENQQKMAAKFKQIVDQSLYLLIGKAQQNASKEDQEYILDKMRPIVKELEVLASNASARSAILGGRAERLRGKIRPFEIVFRLFRML